MATIEKSKRTKGDAYYIRFYNGGRRFKICLPAGITKGLVETLARVVDALVIAQKYGESPPRFVAQFLQAAPPLILAKLSAVHLIAIEKPLLLRDAIAEYMARIEKTNKPRTIKIKRTAFNKLLDYFDGGRAVASITKEEASNFVDFLVSKYASATAFINVSVYSAFWRALAASNAGLTNPFKFTRLGNKTPENRVFDVPSEWTAEILNACATSLDRALFSVYRFGGLRGSEAVALKWSGVNWERRRFVVPSAKTERFAGQASRVVPLFPEIESALSDYFETLPEGAPDLVFPLTYSQAYRRIERAVIAAGLSPWPRLLQNIRATRENELVAAGFPAHIVAAWIGHSVDTQEAHYLRVLDSYFARATSPPPVGSKIGAID